MKALPTAALTVLSLTVSTAHANGLIQKLPKDGSWARYHMTIKDEMPEARERTATMTIRSVGVVTEKGERCRWIEFEVRSQDDAEGVDHLYKDLIPEKDLQPDSSSSTGVLRGWHRDDKGEVRELREPEKSPNGMLAMLLPGSRKAAKKLDEKKTVDYQQGRLECTSRLTGTLKPSEPGAAGVDIAVVYSVWLHEKIPFGVATATYEMTAKRGDEVLGTGTVTFTLDAFGTGAKSALPDKQ